MDYISPPIYFGFCFYPKNGHWSLKDVYDIMIACDARDVLHGVYPCTAPEGGFAWERKFSELGDESAVEVDMRTSGVVEGCGGTKGSWRVDMPADPGYNNSKELLGVHYVKSNGIYIENLVCVNCVSGSIVPPTVEMVVALLEVIREQGHTILSTENFALVDDKIKVTPGKEHKLVTFAGIKMLRRKCGVRS